MFLNTDTHFLAAKGFSSYASANRKMHKVRVGLKTGDKPLMAIITRKLLNQPEDFVVVVFLRVDTLHNPRFFAEKGLYVTSVHI